MKTDEIIISIVILILVFLLVYKYLKREPPEVDQALNIDKLIQQVKLDLEKVDEERIKQQKAALFKVDDFDLELNFVVKQTTSSEASAKPVYELVTIGGKTEVSAEKIQKIKLHMKAIDYSQIETKIPPKNDTIIMPTNNQTTKSIPPGSVK